MAGFDPECGPAPTPDGAPLDVEVPCFVVSGRMPAEVPDGCARHLVTLHPDWTVTMPHDVEAERIAAALGSRSSCLDLVDVVVPAFWRGLDVLLRNERVAIHRGRDGRWRVTKRVRGCCPSRPFGAGMSGAVGAARHIRSTRHLAGLLRLLPWQIGPLREAAERVWGDLDGEASLVRAKADLEVEALVREPGGLLQLWRCGIHPADMVELAAPAAAVPGPLPMEYFLGMALAAPDPVWVRGVLEYRPDGGVASWLAWLTDGPDLGPAERWGAWLRFGLAQQRVRTAVEHDLDPSRVVEVASALGWSTKESAQVLVGWAEAGCRVSARELLELDRIGVARALPAMRALEALVEEEGEVERTELAALLLAYGSRPQAANALRRGVRDLSVATSELVDAGETRRGGRASPWARPTRGNDHG